MTAPGSWVHNIHGGDQGRALVGCLKCSNDWPPKDIFLWTMRQAANEWLSATSEGMPVE